MQGPLEESWLPNMIKMAKEFKPNGVMCWALRGCRHMSASYKVLVDALKREGIDIPVLHIDADHNDPGFVSNKEIMERVEEFVERAMV